METADKRLVVIAQKSDSSWDVYRAWEKGDRIWGMGMIWGALGKLGYVRARLLEEVEPARIAPSVMTQTPAPVTICEVYRRREPAPVVPPEAVEPGPPEVEPTNPELTEGEVSGSEESHPPVVTYTVGRFVRDLSVQRCLEEFTAKGALAFYVHSERAVG